jgi:hypothetical protein
MGKRSAAAKMNAVQSRIRDLGRFGHGCYYCKGNCYTAIAPHLNNLQSWLLEAAKLKATTLDQELLWIFGKSTKILRGAEELRRSRQGGSSSSSTSDCESLDSLVSVATQLSNPIAKRRRTATCHQTDNDRDDFSSDATADSEIDRFNFDDLQKAEGHLSDSSNRARHEAADQAGNSGASWHTF